MCIRDRFPKLEYFTATTKVPVLKGRRWKDLVEILPKTSSFGIGSMLVMAYPGFE